MGRPKHEDRANIRPNNSTMLEQSLTKRRKRKALTTDAFLSSGMLQGNLSKQYKE